jgi:hypothetical protein
LRGANDQAQEESPAIRKDVALLLELERNLAHRDRPDNIRGGEGIQENSDLAASVKRWLAKTENRLVLLFSALIMAAWVKHLFGHTLHPWGP